MWVVRLPEPKKIRPGPQSDSKPAMSQIETGAPSKRLQETFQVWGGIPRHTRTWESSMAKEVSRARWSLESYSIGMKLRDLRTRKRLTLARLAAETGLSTALLSKLETDRMIPTLPTLATICRVFGVGLSYFFAEPARHSLSITRRAHLQGNGRGAEK